MIDYVADWNARLLSRLYEQFKDKANLVALVGVCARQFQDLENAIQTLLTLPSINDSEGAQLDTIGRIVDQPRGGVDDATYRLYLLARIRANHSSGTAAEIYGVLGAMLPDAAMVLVPSRIASFELTIKPPITATQAAVGLIFLGDSETDGVRGILIWQEDVDANMFTLATYVTMVGASASAGDNTVSILDGYALPAAGQAVIDPGLANAETVTYTLAGSTLVLNAPLAHNHTVGAAVELVSDLGLGLGDSSNPSVGGELAGAAQA